MTTAGRRYLVHDPTRQRALRAIDAVLESLQSTGKTGPIPPAPDRLLIALSGHMGDAIIATSAIALARRFLPGAEIGVIVGSWSLAAVEGNPLLDRVHVVDHWMLNRGAPRWAPRMRSYVRTWRQALREIRDARYDVAIDLYPYFPNSAMLLKAASIPVRVGYTSGGFGPLYTHPIDFTEETAHQVEQQAQVIANALGRPVKPDLLHYRLPPIAGAVRQRAAEQLAAAGIASSGYVVAHMAAATPQREWTAAKWRAALEHLAAAGNQIVCTGLAGREAEIAARATAGMTGCANLCGQLSWDELVAVLANAKVVVSVDTSVAHAAAAFDVPTVTLMTTIAKAEHWRPFNARGKALMHPMPCAPCYAREGCAHMSCIRGITVHDVVSSVAEVTARTM